MKAVAIMTPLPKNLKNRNADAGIWQRGILRVTTGKRVAKPDDAPMMKMAPMRRPIEPEKGSGRPLEHAASSSMSMLGVGVGDGWCERGGKRGLRCWRVFGGREGAEETAWRGTLLFLQRDDGGEGEESSRMSCTMASLRSLTLCVGDNGLMKF